MAVSRSRVPVLVALAALLALLVTLISVPPVHAGPEDDPCTGLTATHSGGNGNDTLTGTPGNDVIVGGNGNDTIDGGGGNDVLCGQNGDDTVRGGDGDDTVSGGHGVDTLQGGAGADTITGDNGDDELFGDAGTDSLDGGRGFDVCLDGSTNVDCEDTRNTGADDPFSTLPPAPAGTVTATGRDGVKVVIDSTGGIRRWDVFVGVDDVLTRRTRQMMASPAYDISLPESAPAFTKARITLPYRTDLLGSFPEDQLRIYHFNERVGLWVPAGPNQVVDTTAKTVSVDVTHFSAYGVFKMDEQGFQRYWPTREVFCVQSGDPGGLGVDVAFLIDTSGSMSTSDPSGLRVDGARAFVERMNARDGAAVVGFSSSATTYLGLTRLTTQTERDQVNSALERTRFASGGTSISAAVQRGTTILSGSSGGGRPRVAILMTDGISSYNDALTQAARDAGVVIYTIGLGAGVDAALLQRIADGTGGRYIQLATADQLPAIYDELAGTLIDDGTDTDGDGLTDCEETHGMLVTWGFYDTSFDPTQNEPFLGDHRVTSDPNDPDTDNDGLTDGEELRGRPMQEPLDLRDPDFPILQQEYDFLIEAGITKYFIMRSDPNKVDSDGEGVGDFDETVGKRAANGETYDSRPDRKDCDFDGNDDKTEYEIGTDPCFPDPSELGIPGLPRGTLFQREEYGDRAILNGSFIISRGQLEFVLYNETPVRYNADGNCVSNCDALNAKAAAEPNGDWCWVPFSGCTSDEEQVRNYISEAVARQGVFDEDGLFRGDFADAQAAGECVLTNQDPEACVAESNFENTPDQIELGQDGESLDMEIAEIILNIPGGYRPKDLCGGPSTNSGTYRLTDDATGQVRYVGTTGDFAVRRAQHAADPRYSDLRFEIRHRTSNYQTRRGLEQRDYNDLWGDVPIAEAQAKGSLNGQRPMASSNKSLLERLDLAQLFLDLCL